MRFIVALLAIAATAGPGIAAQRDPNGYAALTQGHYAQAIQTLEAERRAAPSRPELTLNLAAAYARIGRVGEARDLYSQVLARRPVAMDMPSGTVQSSHDVAERGMARLSQAVAVR